MAQIGLDLYFTGFTGDLIVVWKKATSPLAEVGRSAALPFPVDETLAVPNLSPEVYNFEFWQSGDGISLDTLIRGPWSIDASAFSGGIAKRYEYVVGRGHTNVSEATGPEVWADPVEADTQIVDERYAGVVKDDIEVEMRGTGQRRKDEWDVRTGGGIQLSLIGETFSDDDSIFVTVYQKISAGSTAGPSTSSGDYTDVKNVSSNETVDATYANKLINVTGASAVTTISFPALSSLSDQKIKFITHGMTGNYLTLALSGADTISFAGAIRSKIHLPQGRIFEILIKSAVIYVLSSVTDGGYDARGVRGLADDVKPHQRLLDGTVRVQSEYPGIVEWINTLPSGSIITSLATWNTDANKHKYYLNNSTGEFALPSDVGMMYKAASTGQGAYEADQVGEHAHELTLAASNTPNGILIYTRAGAASSTKGHTDTYNVGEETRVKTVKQLPVINL
jgi:hypothetical protein